MSEPLPPVAIFLHAGDYDRMHQGLSIAAAAVASGRRAELFLFWWALERVYRGALDEPDFAGREDVTARFEERRVPTLRSLFEYLKESGLSRTHACTGSVGTLGLQEMGMPPQVDQFVGWSHILRLTAGLADRYYL